MRLAFKVFWDGCSTVFSLGLIFSHYWDNVLLNIPPYAPWGTKFSTLAVGNTISSQLLGISVYCSFWVVLPQPQIVSSHAEDLLDAICESLELSLSLQYSPLSSICTENSSYPGLPFPATVVSSTQKDSWTTPGSPPLHSSLETWSRQKGEVIVTFATFVSLLLGTTVLPCLIAFLVCFIYFI